MEEIWKDIEGYEGLYQVSNMAHVRSLHWNHSNTVRNLKPCYSTGYARVTLFLKGKRKTCLVHVLVAKAFIPNPENKAFVNHKDGNKRNNSLDNLEWVTPKENVHHAIRMGLRSLVCKPSGYKKGKSPISKKIVQKSVDDIVLAKWSSPGDAADILGFDVTSIRRAARGERETYKGFKWEYVA